MTHRPLFVVDAFADKPFSGNPAAVLLLAPGDSLSDADMLGLAQEMNLSETAFVRLPDDKAGRFGLRWFTPVREVDLCGHATLASAHALYDAGRVNLHTPLEFETRSGVLRAAPDADWRGFWLDMPATPPRPREAPAGLLAALGIDAAEFVGLSLPPDGNDDGAPHDYADWFVVVSDPQTVRGLKPDFARLAAAIPDPKHRGVIVTAATGNDDENAADVVSRCFYPAYGLDEDPVTGSAHCTIGPYFARELGRGELLCHQASRRGGSLRVRVDPHQPARPNRVHIGGKAVTTVRGDLVI